MNRLPTEVIQNIAGHLSTWDRLNLAATCHRAREALLDTGEYSFLHEDEFATQLLKFESVIPPRSEYYDCFIGITKAAYKDVKGLVIGIKA